MLNDQQIELVIKIGILAAIGAFWPQIRALLHRIGYRDGESKTGWKRAVTVVGGTFALFAAVIIVAAIFTL